MHKPKYSEACQRLINACQAMNATEHEGVHLGRSAFARYISSMTQEERKMFEFKDLGILKLVTLKP